MVRADGGVKVSINFSPGELIFFGHPLYKTAVRVR